MGDDIMKKTKNYNLFSYMNGNRSVHAGHVSKLVESISKKNLLKYNPIMVDKNMMVIDGQHRLEAAKELGLYVYYNTVDAGLLDVISLNTNAKNWSMSDYVESHIEMGNREYIELKVFKEKWDIGYVVAATLLMGENVEDGGKKARVVKGGLFEVRDRQNANDTMLWVSSFVDYADAVIMRNRSFINAVNYLKDSGLITLSGLKRKISVAGTMLVRQNSKADYLRQIEYIINYKSRKKIRLY